MTPATRLIERLREPVDAFEEEVAENLANELERADLWPLETDVPLALLTEAADRLCICETALLQIAEAKMPGEARRIARAAIKS